jgi:hypothetical protein
MQRYPVRASQRKLLTPEFLAGVAAEHFEGVGSDGPQTTAAFGAIERIAVWVDGRDLAVEVRMNPKVPEAVAADTIKRYNRFLEAATGYTAKERAKRLRHSSSGRGD